MKSILQKVKTNKFIIFLFVGGINTVFGYGIYALFLIVFKLSYPLALGLSTIFGILFNFKTIGIFVFQNSNNKLIIRFILVYGVSYGINLLLLYFLNQLAVDPLIAQALLIIPVAFLGYGLNKKFVFSEI